MYKNKCSAICVFDPLHYTIVSLQLKTRNGAVNLPLHFDRFDHHKSVQHLIVDIVRRCWANNYYIPYRENFGCIWYDIDFIALSSGEILQYGLTNGPVRFKRGRKKNV